MARAFQPKMGRRYATGRNYDLGEGRHRAVSLMSPYTRRRIITEQELVSLALEAHGLNNAEKFIQEVFWRSYFKGWLERRPAIWRDYKNQLDGLCLTMETDHHLRETYMQAIEGRTGIACFDTWIDELTTTGYLHNHARMWFASIWIFTLRLPWELGADFFMRHLLDGDPASNTCSWRWVGGLHSLGKYYEAKPWNIEKFSGGRFSPKPSDLATVTGPIDPNATLPKPTSVRRPNTPKPQKSSVLLLTEEDCSADLSFFPNLTFSQVIALKSSHLRGKNLGPMVCNFEDAALQDAAERLRQQGLPSAEFLAANNPQDLLNITHSGKQIVTSFMPTGPLRDWIICQDIPVAEVMRPWDQAIWPYATAGFFKVKKAVPKVLSALSML
ncbi:MAG: FAD-binding domain-containing protein [Pseudomonadota bacterium]